MDQSQISLPDQRQSEASANLTNMQLILSAVDEALATAWHRFCGDLEFVQVHHGSILDITCDAIVSPANSFGFMDGGIDAIYRKHFGHAIQESVQRLIAERHHGEMLVGAADLVETDNAQIPYMIVAPTMRVPMVLNDSVNPYLAARAALLLVTHHSFDSGKHAGLPISKKIQSLAFPGMGTGIGQIGPNTCAMQMRAAIEDVLLENFTAPRSWAEASERHQLLYTDRPRRMQQDI